MKERDKVLLKAAFFSSILSFVFAVVFSVIFFYIPMSGDLGQVYSVILRVDAVLVGFGAALFTFFVKQPEVKSKKLAYSVAIMAFYSFSVSFLSGFAGLLSGELHFLITPIIPISFTLTGTFTLMAFLLKVGFTNEEEKG